MYLTEVKYYVTDLGGGKKNKKPTTETRVVLVSIKHLKCTIKCTTKQPNNIFSYIKYDSKFSKDEQD